MAATLPRGSRLPEQTAQAPALGEGTRVITTLPALEQAVAKGFGDAWRALVAADPLASPFQSPDWCLAWYRSYHDEFDPYLVAIHRDGVLQGLIPLATERRTREILFASGTMADYRDIVARPGARAFVVRELIRVYLAGRFPNPLQIGWIDPSSDTARLVAEACRERRVPCTSWQQPCHRWMPRSEENLNKKFARVRTHLNALKRQGEVSFDVISSHRDWDAFRDVFFEQHTQWQRQSGRPVSFDDPRKRRFYDRIFDSPGVDVHVVALRRNGQLLSGHVGFLWRKVLMLGAPSVSVEHQQRSPALVLLAWVIQHAGELGLRGLDLTIGDTEFKRRLGNECVRVTMIEVYGRRRSYYGRAIRREAIAVAKGVTAALLGPDAWNTRLLPHLARLRNRGRTPDISPARERRES